MNFFTFLSIAVSLVAAAAPAVYPRQGACAGDLCDRKYSNVTRIGAHDSAFYGSLDDPRINQVMSVTDQLNKGVRFLQSQTHKNSDGELHMCHTSCYLKDAGSVENYLSSVAKWLDSNPGEVLTLLLTNGDNVAAHNFGDAFESSGLKKYAFVPSTSPNRLALEDWPTLNEMVNSGKRLVVFLDYGADETKVPYILAEFHYFFETPYDTTDRTFSQCKLDRPPKSSPDGKMYIVNHFLDTELIGMDDLLVPDNDANFETNAATGVGSIGAQANLCTKTYGRPPNFILVDMFNRGESFEAQKALNAVG